MDERELYEALDSYKRALDLLASENDALKKMVESINERVVMTERTLYDEIIEPAKAQLEELRDADAYGEFKARNGAALEPYQARLAAIEGGDFDINRAAYDGWKEYRDASAGAAGAATEAQYVEQLVSTIDAQMAQIKDALGVPQDADVAVVNDGGKTDIFVDGESVTEAVDVGAGAATDSPEEVQAFEEELLNSLEKSGGKKE